MIKYRGAYPTRIRSVASVQSKLALGIAVTLNDGSAYMVKPLTAKGRAAIPQVGKLLAVYDTSDDYKVSPIVAGIPVDDERNIVAGYNSEDGGTIS